MKTDKEFQDRLIAAMMGKKVLSYREIIDGESMLVVDDHEAWSPSLDGEATKEVRDWFAKEMLGWWERYLDDMTRQYYWEDVTGISLLVKLLNAQLSITNLAQYIVEHYKEMQLNAEVVKIIEETKEGKE